MRTLAFVVVGSLAFAGTALAGDPSPVGRWVTMDEKTNSPRSIIEIADVDGALEGKIVKIYDHPGDVPGHPCRKCSGDLKDKPIVGMTVMHGLKRDGDEWSGGTILDPSSGNLYSAELHLADGGEKLDVRGYLGISLLGRSQTWVRETALTK